MGFSCGGLDPWSQQPMQFLCKIYHINDIPGLASLQWNSLTKVKEKKNGLGLDANCLQVFRVLKTIENRIAIMSFIWI